MSDYVDNFIKQHKDYFKRNRSLIENSGWEKVKLQKTGKNVSYNNNEKDSDRRFIFKQDLDLVKNIQSRLSVFIKHSSADRHIPKTQRFIEYTAEIIRLFLDKCNNYVLDNDEKILDKIKDAESKGIEILFQDYVQNNKFKMEDTLLALNVSNTVEDLEIKFFKDQKSSLLMREPLSIKNKDISLKVDNIDVDWDLLSSQKFYINMNKEDIPVWNHKKHFFDQDTDVLKFWSEEFNKITNGITVGGYFFHPWLYWHMNFFKTPIPIKGRNQVINPFLRDNEWFFAENLKKTEEPNELGVVNRGMLVYGTRRFSKSVILASYTHWKAVSVFNAVATVTGGSLPDLTDLTSKIITSMDYIEPAFKLHIQKQDWDKGDTVLGLKEDASNIVKYSTIRIKNLDGGSKTGSQKTAGGYSSAFVMDEIGKFDFIKPFLAGLPAIIDGDGNFLCAPLLAGCVCAGTKVWDKKGNLHNIEDLKQSDGILGYNGVGVSKEPITQFNPPKEKNCVRIETEGGDYIECSVDHPFLTNKNSVTNRKQMVAKKAEDLKVGDSVFMVDKIDIFGKNHIKDARLLGLMIGDGTYLKQCVQLSCEDEEIYDFINSKYSTHTVKEFKTKSGSMYRATNVRGVTKLFRKHGMLGQSKDRKRLPSDIHNFDKESLCELIGGYFDAVGSVKYDKRKNNIRVCLTSVVKPLLEQVKFQLYKLGIHSIITEEVRKDKTYSDNTQIFRLYINRTHSVKLFKDNISLLCKHKQVKLDKVDELTYSKSTRKPLSGMKFNLTENGKGKSLVGKELKNLYKKRVVSITNIGMKPIYNLTAGKTNTYLANNFVTFNTGGEADLSKDAMKVLSNPESYNLIPMQWDLLESKIDPDQISWKRKVFATFFPAQMAHGEGMTKSKIKFSEFIGVDDDMQDLDILVSNWETNWNYIKNLRDGVKKDKLLLQQKTVQQPIDPEDCLISTEENPFPTVDARKHKQYLQEEGIQGRFVDLYRNEQGVIEATDSTKELSEYPYNGGFHDAPVVLYEDIPQVKPALWKYIAGLDDYKQEESSGDSVGSITIYNRQTGKVAATYNSRPDPHSKFHKNCHYLLEIFNAECFLENEDMGFKEYLDKLHLTDKYLVKGIDFLSDIGMQSNSRRKYGWHPTPKNKGFLLGILKNYTKEEVELEDGSTILGVTTIDDIGILDELLTFKKGQNVDRLTSLMSALGYDYYLTANYITADLPPEIKEKKKKNRTRQPGMYGKRRYSPYR